MVCKFVAATTCFQTPLFYHLPLLCTEIKPNLVKYLEREDRNCGIRGSSLLSIGVRQKRKDPLRRKFPDLQKENTRRRCPGAGMSVWQDVRRKKNSPGILQSEAAGLRPESLTYDKT